MLFPNIFGPSSADASKELQRCTNPFLVRRGPGDMKTCSSEDQDRLSSPFVLMDTTDAPYFLFDLLMNQPRR